MQFRKLAAVTGTALMAGMSIAAPVLATTIADVGSISDIVSVTDSTVSYPLFVVGAAAATADVAGAVDVAVKLAAESKTTSDVTVAGVEETVTGGAKIQTAGDKFNPWDTAGGVRNVLTATEVPNLLGTGTYTPVSGSGVTYKQYLYIQDDTPVGSSSCNATTCNAPHFEFNRPTGENTPRVSFKAPLSQNLTQYKLIFQTPVAFSGVTSVGLLQTVLQGTAINMLGKDFVISDCAFNANANPINSLTLLGGRNVVTVSTAADQTVTSAGTDYTVHLEGVAVETVGSTNYYTALGNVNGESFSLRAAQTKELSDGTTIAAIRVLQGKTGEADFATIAIGAEKLTVPRSGTVTRGTTTVTGLTSTITDSSTGWSSLELVYAPNEDNFVNVGEEIEDPFSAAYTIKFNSIYPDFDDTTNRQTISLTPSGFNIIMNYKNAAGNDEQVYAMYINSTTVSSSNQLWGYAAVSGTGSDNSFRDLIFDEYYNISAIDGDYFVIGSGGFSHVLRFSSLATSGSTITLTFVDEVGGTISTTNTSATGGSLIIDGNSYNFNITDSTNKKVKMDLNRDGYISNETSAAPALTSVNAQQTGVGYSFLTPKLISSGQGGVYFYRGSSVDANTTTWVYPAIGIGAIRWRQTDVTNIEVATRAPSATSWTAGTNMSIAGTGTLTASGAYTVNYIDFIFNCTNASGAVSTLDCTTSLGTAATANYTYPGVVLMEEQQEGGAARNWIYVPFNYSSQKVQSITGTPVSDDTNFANEQTAVIGTTGENKGLTTYGTLIQWDTTAGTASWNYPDGFMYANVYVLEPGGTIGTGGAAGTVTTETVLPIVTDVVRLDSEVTDTDKTNRDLILVGGPCINTLVASLADDGTFDYTCDSWPGRDFGMIKVVNDAFTTGKVALIIAGTRAADTDLAALVVQAGTALTGQTADTVEVTGTVSSPTVTPA